MKHLMDRTILIEDSAEYVSPMAVCGWHMSDEPCVPPQTLDDAITILHMMAYDIENTTCEACILLKFAEGAGHG